MAHFSQDNPLHLAQSGSLAQYLFGELDGFLTDLECDLFGDFDFLTGDLDFLTGLLAFLTGDFDFLAGDFAFGGDGFLTGVDTLTGLLDLTGDLVHDLDLDLLLTGDFPLPPLRLHTHDEVYCLVFEANVSNPSEANNKVNFIIDICLINNYDNV